MGLPASPSGGTAGACGHQSRPQAAAPDRAGLRSLSGLLLGLLRRLDGLGSLGRVRLLLGLGASLAVGADPELLVHLPLELRGQLRVVAQELLGVVAALAEPRLAVGEER